MRYCALLLILALSAAGQTPLRTDATDGVMTWLKINQDTSSLDKNLMADVIGGASAQTFNNSLAAMAFMLEGERERAERILDFYAGATNVFNEDPRRQNFFYRGEPLGFFQNMAIHDLKDAKFGQAIWNGDRWMGDMAWLFFACAQHDKIYANDRYEKLRALICELLASWFVPVGEGGYIGSGWRNFDRRLHEADGHEEGNIDAYAVMKTCGRDDLADRIATWLIPRLSGSKRPLDHVTWRVLAIGGDPWWIENSPGYKKTVTFRDREVTGFASIPSDADNIWCEGLGHVACAYYAIGDVERGDFYTTEMEKLMIPLNVRGQDCLGIPFTTSNSGGYEWVKLDEGFVSSAAWYIFARHRFNPMRLQ